MTETETIDPRAGRVGKSEFRLPDGTWSCVRDGVTEPCGDCDGCRHIAAINARDRMAGPRYETAHQLAERTGKTDTVVCTDCGVFVMDKTAHTRFHLTLSGQVHAGNQERLRP